MRKGSGRIGQLMAAGMDWETACDEARLIAMRNYQKRRYANDPDFKARVLERKEAYGKRKR